MSIEPKRRCRAFGLQPNLPNDGRRRFVAHVWPTGWNNISLGVNVDVSLPNIEIHLPFCFIKFGFDRCGRLGISGEMVVRYYDEDPISGERTEIAS